MVVGDDLEEEWINVDVIFQSRKSESRNNVDFIVYRPAEGAGRGKSRRLRLGGKQAGDVRYFLVTVGTRTTSFQTLASRLISILSAAAPQTLPPLCSQASSCLSL